MISATKEKLASYFQGNSQFVVPFFQRSYVWDVDNWAAFWDHVVSVEERYQADKSGEHFIGTIIAKRSEDTGKLGEATYELIDGQQRLTTVALFLKAISDASSGQLPRLKEKVSEHLQFRDAHDKLFPRVVLNGYDRKYYEAVISGDYSGLPEKKDHKIIAAYEFFRKNLDGFPDERLDQLRLVILERVPLISMMLAPEDDEQEIFDTINALGVRLTTAELLKNYIFKEEELRSSYETLWRDVFEDSEEHVDFWNAEKTAGRVIRTNLEVLLYCYLIIKTGKPDVKLEKLFKEYKQWLQNRTPQDKKAFLEELGSYAEIYASFPSGPDLNQIRFQEQEKRFFHLLENLSVTTAYPPVLYIYRNVSDHQTRDAMLGTLESYLVRRNVCRLTTKNYNLLFIQMANKLKEALKADGAINAESLASIIRDYTEDTNRMPSDAEFETAFGSQRLSNQNAREILFVVALCQVSTGLADVPKLSLGNYSVEHMMPVKWHANWMDREMNDLEMAERDRKLKTLGNLTLVTKRLNSKMQNAAWSVKKRVLRDNSSLPMTVSYVDAEKWDEAAIQQRGLDLFDVAKRVWPLGS